MYASRIVKAPFPFPLLFTRFPNTGSKDVVANVLMQERLEKFSFKAHFTPKRSPWDCSEKSSLCLLTCLLTYTGLLLVSVEKCRPSRD